MQSPSRLIISLALAAGVFSAGLTYFSYDPRPMRDQAMAALIQGRYQRAERLMKRHLEADPSKADDWYELGNAQHKQAKQADALASWKIAAKLQKDAVDNPKTVRWLPLANYNLACYRALAGDQEGALHALEASIQGGYLNTAHMRTDIDLDSIRNEPRFAAALELADRKRAERPGEEGTPPDRPRSRSRNRRPET